MTMIIGLTGGIACGKTAATDIFRKLGVNNVHEATKYAMRAGIIDVAEYCI